VRNPWERFGSAHRYNIDKGSGVLPKDVNDAAKMLADGVAQAVTLRSLIPQVKFAKGVSFVGRFENIDADFADVCGKLGLHLSLPTLNTAAEPLRHLETFTPATIEILNNYYADDIATFGYRLPT